MSISLQHDQALWSSHFSSAASPRAQGCTRTRARHFWCKGDGREHVQADRRGPRGGEGREALPCVNRFCVASR